MINPLLTNFSLPPFSCIKPEHAVPAVIAALYNCRTITEKVIKNNKFRTWDNLYQPLSEVNNTLERIISVVSHLHSVQNSPEWREAYEVILPLISEYNTWVNQKKKLYQAYQDMRRSKNFLFFEKAKKKAVENILLEFEMSGINLSKKKQKRYAEISELLTTLENQFNNNVIDATVNWKKWITDKKVLDGVPDIALENLKKENGWLLTLNQPNYISIMTYCNNQSLREEMYRAFNTRASDQDPLSSKWDNSSVINDILKLRQEKAKLLGFKNYAAYSLTTNMAKNTRKVFNFLKKLINIFLPLGRKELSNLYNFAKFKYGIKKLYPWDIAWYSEKQKKCFYNVHDELFRSYFPENKVINGLFEIVRRIYGIFIKERYDIDVWDAHVRFFEVYDKDHQLCGSFYLDLYTRENKNSGAWMDNCMNRMRKSDGTLQKPVAYLTCNFHSPSNNNPTLLSCEEIITLFHEFGHVLQHVLTSIEISDVSGINGVPWDAVEFPSQFMEHWFWESDVLEIISGHYKTHEPLPKNLKSKILSLKNFQKAMSILHQLELGLFDFRLHTEFDSQKQDQIVHIMEEIKKNVSVIPSPTWNRFSHTFSHIFSGSYAAKYYSYLWANILSTDAYSRFKEEGLFNYEVGQSFLNNILSQGGSEEPVELFKKFRGHEPKINAMLEYHTVL